MPMGPGPLAMRSMHLTAELEGQDFVVEKY
jgi:hypothetical protein